MLRFHTSSYDHCDEQPPHNTSFRFPNLFKLFQRQLSHSFDSEQGITSSFSDTSLLIEKLKKTQCNQCLILFNDCSDEQKQSLLQDLRILRINGQPQESIEKLICKHFHLFKYLPFEAKQLFLSSIVPKNAQQAFSKLTIEDQKQLVTELEIEEIEYTLSQLPIEEQIEVIQLIEKEAKQSIGNTG